MPKKPNKGQQRPTKARRVVRVEWLGDHCKLWLDRGTIYVDMSVPENRGPSKWRFSLRFLFKATDKKATFNNRLANIGKGHLEKLELVDWSCAVPFTKVAFDCKHLMAYRSGLILGKVTSILKGNHQVTHILRRGFRLMIPELA